MLGSYLIRIPFEEVEQDGVLHFYFLFGLPLIETNPEVLGPIHGVVNTEGLHLQSGFIQ